VITEKVKDLLKKIFEEDSSAHSVALGIAIGIFIGFLPIYGFQMIPAFLLAVIFKINKAATVAGVWITNPLTAIPVYLFNLWVGLKITGYNYTYSQVKLIVGEYNLQEIFSLGTKLLLALMIGSIITGFISAVLVYYPVKFLMRMRNKRLRQKQQK